MSPQTSYPSPPPVSPRTGLEASTILARADSKEGESREGDSKLASSISKAQPQSAPGETAKYGAGYVVFAASRVLRDLAVARILGPSRFGIWGALLVYRQYSNYSDLGFTNGLGRVLPQLLQPGKEKEAQARQAMGTAWVVAMAGTLVFALAVALKFLPAFSSSSAVTLWGVTTVVGLMFVDKHYMYCSVVFRSTQRVGESGLWMGALGAVEFALAMALTRRFGLYGLYVSVVLAGLTVVGCMSLRQPLRGVFRPDLASVKVLLIPSLILMGLGLGNIAMHSVDRVVILWARGPGAELGEYQVAASISLVVSQLPYILLTVLVPKLFRFGRENGAQLRPYFLLPTAVIAMLSSVVGSMGYIVLPALLHWLLPQYVLASSLAGILMLGEVCFAIAMVPESLIVALDRGSQTLLVRGCSVAGAMSASWWALSHGHGLHAVAGCMCGAQAAAALMAGGLAAHALRISPLRYLAAALVPLLYVVMVMLLVGVFTPAPAAERGSAAVFMKLALCGIALAPMAVVPLWFLGARWSGLRRILGYLYWSEGV